MPNASTAAARQGFAFYTQEASPPALSTINEALTFAGYSPVSERMFDHYRRLVRYGYTSYVPVNELDVAVKASRMGRAS